MSPLPSEPIVAMQKANFDMLFDLGNTAVEGLQNLLALNLQAVKSTFADGHDNALKMLSLKDPQELVLQSCQMQDAAEKVQAYTHQAFAIAAAAQTEFAKVAETQYQAHTHRVQTLVDTVGKSAPAGSDAAIAAWKSAATAGNMLYETVNQVTRRAVEITGNRFSLVPETAQRADEHASRSAKK